MKYFKRNLMALIAICLVNLPLSPNSHAEGGKLLRAAIAVDRETKPASSFSSDVPKLFAFYIGESLKEGDSLRGVWIAEDVGTAAPANTKIDESSLVVKSPTDNGAFSISKPTNGWPIGSYRIEIYVGDKLAETVKFKITTEDESDADADYVSEESE